ncbi:hypothetical protein [Legionella sp.]|uniref:hypothetical protein n=1 Tax=Legionella sp. TaxID=459 RepID=UPI003C92185F
MTDNVKIKAKQDLENIVRKKATQDAEDATRKHRQELRNLREQQDADNLSNLSKKRVKTDKQGQEISLWDELAHKADEAVHSEQHAYHDWRAAMMSLLAMYSLLVKAVSEELDVKIKPPITVLKQLVREEVLYPLKDRIVDAVRGQPRVDLPKLIHSVTMSDDNKLMIDDVKCAGSKPIPEFNPAFRTLVSLWLNDQGYEPAAEDTYTTNDAHKTELTKERFEELKNSKEFGLNTFLEENVNLQFKDSTSPTP